MIIVLHLQLSNLKNLCEKRPKYEWKLNYSVVEAYTTWILKKKNVGTQFISVNIWLQHGVG